MPMRCRLHSTHSMGGRWEGWGVPGPRISICTHAARHSMHECAHAQQPQMLVVLAWPWMFQVGPSSKGAYAHVLCMHSMGSMGGVGLHGKRNHACNSDVAASRMPSQQSSQGPVAWPAYHDDDDKSVPQGFSGCMHVASMPCRPLRLKARALRITTCRCSRCCC